MLNFDVGGAHALHDAFDDLFLEGLVLLVARGPAINRPTPSTTADCFDEEAFDEIRIIKPLGPAHRRSPM